MEHELQGMNARQGMEALTGSFLAVESSVREREENKNG